MFNPAPVVQRIRLGESVVCVVDDALADPDAWVREAASRSGSFIEAAYNAYPGAELRLPEPLSRQCGEFFDRHLRAHFNARRTLRMHAKLAMVSRAPGSLQPVQTIPHVDDLALQAGQLAIASVLYLFRDEALGGTSFYRPRVEPTRLAELMRDAARLDAAEFSIRHGVPRAYPSGSGAWFERVLTLPPRWNRLIAYSGTIFHSGDIQHPDRMAVNPTTGRLTLNAFYVCRRTTAP